MNSWKQLMHSIYHPNMSLHMSAEPIAIRKTKGDRIKSHHKENYEQNYLIKWKWKLIGKFCESRTQNKTI